MLARPSRKLIRPRTQLITANPDQDMDNLIPIDIAEGWIAAPPPQIQPTHLISLWSAPICCLVCRRAFKTHEKAWQFYMEVEPRCLTDVPVFESAQQARGWFMVQIIVISPEPKYTLAADGKSLLAPLSKASEVPRLCEMCGLLVRLTVQCGQCEITACQVCAERTMHRCAFYCPYRACSGCSPMHNCPNIVE